MAKNEILHRESGSALLVHPDYENRVTEDWFRAEFWGEQAQPVSAGGRGGAWFLNADGDPLVLREYRRGGLVAKLSRNAYTFTGEQSVRSFAEFRLLNRMIEMGLPVPKPVAAWYRKLSPVKYRAGIIIERLEDASPLPKVWAEMTDEAWHELGQLVRRFHQAGVRHADLNCFNVLFSKGRFYLIDFDKGQLMPSVVNTRWRKANLDRFARSLRKVAGNDFQKKVWDAFMKGYTGRSLV